MQRLSIVPIGNGRTFILADPVRVTVPVCASRFKHTGQVERSAEGFSTITVPAGFSTDLASVPRWLWVILPPMGRYSNASVVHDWLCKVRPCISRIAADIFLELMVQDNVPKIQRWTLYAGVRLFGPRF